MAQIESSLLPSGLPLHRLALPGTKAVTVLTAFDAGARAERPEENGMAHFLEHLVFKGGEKYPTYRDVNETAERKAIVRKQMIGAGQPLTRPDVMRHIADNISRFIEPERASDVLRRASRIERIQPCGATERVRPPEDKSAIGQPEVTFHAVAYVRPSDSHCRTGVRYHPRQWLQRRSASIRPARRTRYDR